MVRVAVSYTPYQMVRNTCDCDVPSGRCRSRPPRTWRGIKKIDVGQRSRADDVDGGHGEQGGADTVAADIEQVDGEMGVVDPVVAEGVAAELGGGIVCPDDPKAASPSARGRMETT